VYIYFKPQNGCLFALSIHSEAESVDSHPSSFGPHTPSTCTHSTNEHAELPKAYNFTFSTTDISANTIDDPAITSMEVELSVGSAVSSALGPTPSNTGPYMNTDPTTPQRASQVFSFITKRNTIERIPSRIPFSSSSDMIHDWPRSRFSTDESSLDVRASRQSFGTFQEKNRTPMRTPVQRTPKPKPQARRASAANDDDDDPSDAAKRKVRVLMSGPTKIVVTAPTPGTQGTPSRIPIRGPRQHPGSQRKTHSGRRKPMLTNRSANGSVSSHGSSRSKDSSTNIPRRKPSHRSASRASDVSSASSRAEADAIAVTVCALDQLARKNKAYHHISISNRENGDKENQQLAAKTELPSTPLKSHHTPGRSALFRKAVTPNLFQRPHSPSAGSAAEKENSPVRETGMGPSGNSSSELSPVGKQMMMDARKQRMKGRVSEGAPGLERERRSWRRSTAARAGLPF
jgi:hypothetical protein